MNVKPVKWSVIIVGWWNPHILTPAGIAQRVFKEDSGTQVRVEVPLDGENPYRVFNKDESLSATCTDQKLSIEPSNSNYDSMRIALDAGINILNSLPETPVEAVGFNINFKHDGFDPDYYGLISSNLDESFTEKDLSIVEREFKRSIRYNDGRINVTSKVNDDHCALMLNFHRASKDRDELKAWLSEDIESIKAVTAKFADIFKCELEDK